MTGYLLCKIWIPNLGSKPGLGVRRSSNGPWPKFETLFLRDEATSDACCNFQSIDVTGLASSQFLRFFQLPKLRPCLDTKIHPQISLYKKKIPHHIKMSAYA
jgi:hypothetical protein